MKNGKLKKDWRKLDERLQMIALIVAYAKNQLKDSMVKYPILT